MVNTLKIWWARFQKLPGGPWFFSQLIRFFIPYTGTVAPRVLELRPGFARVSISDRRTVRNHLRSIHAIALSNLGEFTTGLAVHFAMEPNTRAILTRLDTEFIKKARGPIQAVSEATLPSGFQQGPLVVEARLFDDQENIVAKVTASWLVGKVNARQNK